MRSPRLAGMPFTIAPIHARILLMSWVLLASPCTHTIACEVPSSDLEEANHASALIIFLGTRALPLTEVRPNKVLSCPRRSSVCVGRPDLISLAMFFLRVDGSPDRSNQ